MRIGKRPASHETYRPRSAQHASIQSSSNQHDKDIFFRYTSGRWLWEEPARLQERYRKFNVPALQHIAARHAGANQCISMTKIAEGGFNKIFRLVMDNGAALIARIPHNNVGPLSKSVASEVATMDFVRCQWRNTEHY